MTDHQGSTSLDQNNFKTNVMGVAAEYVSMVPDLAIDNNPRIKCSRDLTSVNIQKLESEKNSPVADLKKEMADQRQKNLTVTDMPEHIKAEKAASGADLKMAADLSRRLREQDETIKKMNARHTDDVEELNKLITGLLDPAERGCVPKSVRDIACVVEGS